VVFGGDAQVAAGLLPPGLPGYSDDLSAIPFDPDAARRLLDESRYADNIPPIVYTTSGLGSVSSMIQFIVESWREHLGVDIEIRQLAPDAYYYQLYDEVDNLFTFGWTADYPDPENFLDILLHSQAVENNVGHYSNDVFDRLLEEARSERDTARRMALYREAEQLLLDDVGIIPLYHSPDYVLTRPHVEGFAVGPLGIPLLQNVTIGDH
jgi:oligopeptide transport system substrate-binding protein